VAIRSEQTLSMGGGFVGVESLGCRVYVYGLRCRARRLFRSGVWRRNGGVRGFRCRGETHDGKANGVGECTWPSGPLLL
jgi:hypothetical protein